VDVYVDRQGRVWVMDLAPWGPPTDALLFEWGEEEEEGGREGGREGGGGVSLVLEGGLEGGREERGEEGAVFRVVDGERVRVLPDPWSGYRVPLEMHGCVGGGGGEEGRERGGVGALDLEAVMWATIEERKRRGKEGGGVESESNDEDEDEEERGGEWVERILR